MSAKIGFVTPPKAAPGPGLSRVEKQRLIENLELEVQDRTRHFHGALTDILNSFLVRQESEILRIPKDLRNVKMKDLKSMWGGDWASTLRHLKEETLKGKIEGDRTEEGKRMEEGLLSEGNGDKRKRKRPEAESREGSIDIGAERAKKTPRRAENLNVAPPPPASTAKTPTGTGSRLAGFFGKRPLLPVANTLSPAASSPFKRFDSRPNLAANSTASPSKPSRFAGFKLPTMSSLSRDTTKSQTPAPAIRTFEPAIPEVTPRFPREMKDTDVVLSANGSPIANPWTLRREASETSEDENELPDPEALEKAMMARNTPRFDPGPSRPNRAADLPRQMARKRISSIRIRQSISMAQPDYYDPFVDATPTKPSHTEKPSSSRVAGGGTPELNESPAQISSRGAMLRLTTSSGLTIDFDPFTDDPEMVEEELRGKGVGEDVRGQVRMEMAKKVKELRERLASFKI